MTATTTTTTQEPQKQPAEEKKLKKFGHPSDPTIVYKFEINQRLRCFSDKEIRKQLALARRYRNLLIEGERESRKVYREKRQELYPDYAAQEALCKEQSEAVEALYTKINSHKAKERTSKVPAELKAQVKDAKTRRAESYKRLKEMATEIAKDEDLKTAANKVRDNKRDSAEEWANLAGLYQATKRRVREALDQALATTKEDPVFTSWDGTGRLSLQLQAQNYKPKVTFQLISLGGRATELKVRQEGKYHVFSVRIGSDQNKKPIFAECPVVLHREFPSDAAIKWVELVCKRTGRGYKYNRSTGEVGRTYEYYLCFQLSRKEGWDKPDRSRDPDKLVAVNPGWRQITKGGIDYLRVAYWVGSDGAEGELLIPLYYRDAVKLGLGGTASVEYAQKPDSLRSIRDRIFNEMKEKLADYLRGTRAIPTAEDGRPSAFAEQMTQLAQYLHAIRSKDRILDFLHEWEQAGRHAGDSDILTVLQQWRRDEIHLERWESDQRAKFTRWRQWYYRNFWSSLRRQYSTIVVDDTNYADLRRTPSPEEASLPEALIAMRNVASCGELLRRRRDKDHNWFVNDLPALVVPAKGLTSTCHYCLRRDGTEHEIEFNRARVDMTCDRCETTIDQDRNHCLNTLKRAQEQLASQHQSSGHAR